MTGTFRIDRKIRLIIVIVFAMLVLAAASGSGNIPIPEVPQPLDTAEVAGMSYGLFESQEDHFSIIETRGSWNLGKVSKQYKLTFPEEFQRSSKLELSKISGAVSGTGFTLWMSPDHVLRAVFAEIQGNEMVVTREVNYQDIGRQVRRILAGRNFSLPVTCTNVTWQAEEMLEPLNPSQTCKSSARLEALIYNGESAMFTYIGEFADIATSVENGSTAKFIGVDDSSSWTAGVPSLLGEVSLGLACRDDDMLFTPLLSQNSDGVLGECITSLGETQLAVSVELHTTGILKISVEEIDQVQ